MKSEKVVLSKEVAEAISYLQGNFNYTFQDFMQVKSAGGWNKEEGTFSLNNLNIETLAAALINGYETEFSPEEKVRDYYESYETSSEEAYAIKQTLNLLGMTIKGVNLDD